MADYRNFKKQVLEGKEKFLHVFGGGSYGVTSLVNDGTNKFVLVKQFPKASEALLSHEKDLLDSCKESPHVIKALADVFSNKKQCFLLLSYATLPVSEWIPHLLQIPKADQLPADMFYMKGKDEKEEKMTNEHKATLIAKALDETFWKIRVVQKHIKLALEALHKEEIVHQDVTLVNMLVEQHNDQGPATVKLAHFDLAKKVGAGEKIDNFAPTDEHCLEGLPHEHKGKTKGNVKSSLDYYMLGSTILDLTKLEAFDNEKKLEECSNEIKSRKEFKLADDMMNKEPSTWNKTFFEDDDLFKDIDTPAAAYNLTDWKP